MPFPTSSEPSERSSRKANDALADARGILRTVWKYDDFRPEQAKAVSQVVGGRDGLVLMPTGGGKSIAFQVPALLRGGLTVVISPLVSLMQDQVAALAGKGVPAFALTGKVGFDVAGYVNRRIAASPAFLLYVAPERIGSPLFTRVTRGCPLNLLVVDEAHCISSWGHDFRPAYRLIARLRDDKVSEGSPACVAFTATATPAVERDIIRSLELKNPFRLRSSFRRANIAFVVRSCVDPSREVFCLVRQARGSSIVYDTSREGTEVWAEKLRRVGLQAAAYHAGMDVQHRSDVQSAWLQGRVKTVVATNAFGMGIDKPDVRLVVHAGIPESLEGWYQEAGRAGRDGRPALAVTFDSPDARKARRALVEAPRIRVTGEESGVRFSIVHQRWRGRWRSRMAANRARSRYAAMRRWLDRDACRTWGLLGYFGEAAPVRCEQCDRCVPDLISMWESRLSP